MFERLALVPPRPSVECHVDEKYALPMILRRMSATVALAAIFSAAIGCLVNVAPPPPGTSIDADLLDVTRCRTCIACMTQRKYTVTEVVQWHLDRIDRYNGVYGAIETVFHREALADAAREDAAVTQGSGTRGPLWGVPIVIKANTSIKGQVTTAGWEGFRRAGHELVSSERRDDRREIQGRGRDHRRARQHARPGQQRHEPQQLVRADRERLRRPLLAGRFVRRSRNGRGVEHGGAGQRHRYRQLDTDAGGHQCPGRRVPQRAAWSVPPASRRLDWLLDNTGPIARTAADAAIALAAMAGEDPLDFRTSGLAGWRQRDTYEPYLKPDALKGKRFGVPRLRPAQATAFPSTASHRA